LFAGVLKNETIMRVMPSNHHLTTRTTANPNHHLWNNNGTWWLHFTLRSATGATKRHRFSLKTANPEAARQHLNDMRKRR
jgi:hypothetical protein